LYDIRRGNGADLIGHLRVTSFQATVCTGADDQTHNYQEKILIKNNKKLTPTQNNPSQEPVGLHAEPSTFIAKVHF